MIRTLDNINLFIKSEAGFIIKLSYGCNFCCLADEYRRIATRTRYFFKVRAILTVFFFFFNGIFLILIFFFLESFTSQALLRISCFSSRAEISRVSFKGILLVIDSALILAPSFLLFVLDFSSTGATFLLIAFIS